MFELMGSGMSSPEARFLTIPYLIKANESIPFSDWLRNLPTFLSMDQLLKH